MAARRIVLDTNVLVSALLNQAGAPARCLEAVLDGRWQPLVSAEIVKEYEDVLRRRKLGLTASTISETMARLTRAALLVVPQETVAACADQADDKFLACCLAGAGEAVVTGNLKDYPKSPFMGILILSPSQFNAEFL